MEPTAFPTTAMSSSDMLSGVPADMFSNLPADSGPDLSSESALDDDAAVDDGVIDVQEPEATGTDDTVIEDPAGDEEAEPVAEPADKAEPKDPADPAKEDLPEGVRKGKDRKGKDGYFLEENRYKNIYGNHQLVQSAAEILGEPLTAEAIKLRNDAYLGNERLFSNLTSGDIKGQTDVVNYILNEMSEAQKNGEVGVDPTIPFAESVYTSLKEKSPDGYANLRLVGARDLIDEMFQAGAARAGGGDLSLFSAAQHFAITIANVGPKPESITPEQYVELCHDKCARMGISFHTNTDIPELSKAEDPTAALSRENAALKAQLNGRPDAGTAEQFDTWRRASFENVNKAVFDDAVTPALASVAEGWKNHPDDYKRLVTDPLHRDIVAALKADTGLKEQVAEKVASAKRATSEQVRSRLSGEIRQLYIHRAKQAAARLAPPIISFAANTLKGQSDATHERRSGAQTRTAPKGPSAPVKQSLVPALAGFKNGVYDRDTALRQAVQLIGGR